MISQTIKTTLAKRIGQTLAEQIQNAKVTVVNATTDLVTVSVEGDIVSVDLETSGLDWQRNEVLLISIADSLQTSIVLDVSSINPHELRAWLHRNLFGRLIVGHNLSFDLKFLARVYDFDLRSCAYYDTMLSEIVLFAGLDYGNSLKEIVARRIGLELDKTIRADFTAFGRTLTMTDTHYRYASLDALTTLAVRELQLVDLRTNELEQIAELEMRLLPVVVEMELGGVPFDWQRFETFVSVLHEKRTLADRLMQEALQPAALRIAEHQSRHTPQLFVVPQTININSKPVCKDGVWNYGQLWPALQQYGIEIVDKDGNPSLSAKDMQRWDATHTVDVAIPPEAEALLQSYRQYRNPLLNLYAYTIAIHKLDDSFVKTLREMYHNGRLYPWFKQLGAKSTGRFSSNLQQLPKDEKIKPIGLPSLRQCIAAEPDHSLVIADFAGIELVILADMSGDEVLGDLIVRSARGEEDIHLYVVRQAFGDLYPEAKNATLDKKKVAPYSLLRNAAKPTSYGIAYGITGMALSETISQQLAPLGVTCTPEQAQQIIDNWKQKAFRKAGAWLDKTAQQGQRLGYVRTALGRKRMFDLRNAGRKALSAIGREASNATIQGTCADMLKLAMVYVAKDLDPARARLILTVHDELVLHTTNDYAQDASMILKQSMEKAARKCMPRMGQYVVVEPAISSCYDK